MAERTYLLELDEQQFSDLVHGRTVVFTTPDGTAEVRLYPTAPSGWRLKIKAIWDVKADAARKADG